MLYLLIIVLVPMLVIALLFYFLLERFFSEERAKRSEQFKIITQKEFLPQKYQAYERIALFLERIRPSSLVSRTQPFGSVKDYELHLVKTIQTEFEHNLSQQIYINPETWKIVFSAKNATLHFIKSCVDGLPEDATAEVLREEIIKKSINESIPSNQAMLYLQKDIQGNF